MEAIDYVKTLKLDQENFEFKREEFLQTFGKDFLEYCQTTQIGRDSKGKLAYYRFQEIVKNFEGKFHNISKLKKGKPLSQGLWKAFYAKFVVPYRTKIFPEYQARIQRDKKARNKPNKSH